MTAVFTGTALRRMIGDGDGARFVVDGVNLRIDAGELVLLVGPSGSGKTTLLHLVSGFDRPTGGDRAWIGVDGVNPPWRTVGVVPQSLGLLAELSYAEQLDLAIRHLPSSERRAEVRRRLDQLGIAHLATRLAEETSLGQQQRLAVARALITCPALVVADEPTSRQDQTHAEVVADALRAAADDGSACLVASHDALLRRIADRVVTITDGMLADPPLNR